MKPARYACLCLALLLPLAFAAPLSAEVTIEIESDTAARTHRVATDKNLLLVLPERFFRARGETSFSTPYIAELFFTTDAGHSWTSYGLFKELDKPFEFTADIEARYGFFVTLVDRSGNHDAIPETGSAPQVSVLVDWTPPKVELIAPTGGEVAGPNAPLEVKWTADDLFLAEDPISIETSADDSKTWKTIASSLENTGLYVWNPPAGSDGRLKFRVTAVDEASHATSASSLSAVLVDTTPPAVTIVGPTLSAAENVTLELAADDADGSGLSEIKLWSSLDNGVTWAPAGSFTAGSPVTFSSPTGKYALFALASDRAGNSSPAPAPGGAPQVTLHVDTATPIVKLKTLNLGGGVSGSSRIPIQWEAVSPKPSPKPISIYLSTDGGNTWTTIVDSIANSGDYFWEVSSRNSSNCKLKIEMRDSSGATGVAMSAKPFTIDSTRPTSAIGVAPADLPGPVGDLGQVLRPLGGSAMPVPDAAPETSSAPVTPSPPAEPPKTPAPSFEGQTTFFPESTPSPSAPWTSTSDEPYAGPLAADASFEDVLKAAFAAYNAEQFALAKNYFLRAAAANDNDPRPHAALGRIYIRAAEFNYSSKKEAFEAALYEFEKALALSGGDPDVLNDMGFALLQTKRFTDAVDVLERATTAGSKPIYWYNLGVARHALGKNTKATDAFLKAVELDPKMKEACFFLGRLYAGAGQWQQSRDHFQKAVDGYGADTSLGKVALAGLQKAREALGEVSPEDSALTMREKLDRVR